MKIAIGCDPNAQQAKEELIKFMEDKGYGEIKDFGAKILSTPTQQLQLQKLLLPASMTAES